MEIILGGNKGLSTFVDDDDYRTFNLGSYKWYAIIGRWNTYAYAYNNIKTLYLHRLIMGIENAPGSVCVDHIDGNGLNNSRTNLRITDIKGNRRNSRKHLSTKFTSSYKGISYAPYRRLNPWRAQITLLNGKQKSIGFYRTEREAIKAYNKVALELFGPMAYLNVLPDQK